MSTNIYSALIKIRSRLCMVCGERRRDNSDETCKGCVKIVSVNYRIVYLLVLPELQRLHLDIFDN